MNPTARKRRNAEDEIRRPKKKIKNFKKQKHYHSSSEDDSDDERPARNNALRISVATRRDAKQQPKKPTIPTKAAEDEAHELGEDIELAEDDDQAQDDNLQINTILNMQPTVDSEEDAEEGSEGRDDIDEDLDSEDGGVQIDNLDDVSGDSDVNDDDDLADQFDSDDPSETSTAATESTTRKKRNDPSAFATSISKILTTKLSTQKRADPILSRSKTAEEANKALADEKLEVKARASIRAEKRSLLERGRVKDVLGLETPDADTGAIMELEKRLKKTAQRGVVKLFNAVRAAQVKAEEAERAARSEGVIGMKKREERINEMSKEGFLDLISRGGTTVES